MCHETNQRCAGQVQYIQNVSLAVELQRFIGEMFTVRQTILASGALDDIAATYESGLIDGLAIVGKKLQELAPVVQPAE